MHAGKNYRSPLSLKKRISNQAALIPRVLAGLERLEGVTELFADRSEALVDHHGRSASEDKRVAARWRQCALHHILGHEADESAPDCSLRHAVDGVIDLHPPGVEIVQTVLQ